MAESRSSSLHGTTLDSLMNIDLRCVVGLEVENQTDWWMRSPSAYCSRGTVKIPPREIGPKYKEVMVATKRPGSVFGSFGSVSWKLSCKPSADERRVVVMWCDPFNYNHYSNTLAIGITRDLEAKRNWTDLMYDGKVDNVDTLKFVQGEFYNNVQQISVSDDLINVTGIMSNEHHASIQVVVRPKM
jgi:hypothetical protein